LRWLRVKARQERCTRQIFEVGDTAGCGLM